MKFYFFVFFSIMGLFQVQAQNPLRKGKDYAVFFYVTEFDNRGAWQSLPYTKVEAENIGNELSTNFGFDVQYVANPTLEGIKAKLEEINLKTYNPDDQILFFFSMHGYYKQNSESGYLVPRNGKSTDFNSWLSYATLRDYLGDNTCKHIYLVLDACFSGAFAYKDPPITPAWEQEPDCEQKMAKALKFKSRIFAASGNRNERTPAKSLLAYKFLETLRVGGSNGFISARLMNFELSEITNPTPETGIFTGNEAGGSFVFVKKNACISNTPPPITGFTSEREAFEAAKVKGSLYDYENFLRQYPSSQFKPLIDAEINKIKDRQADNEWQRIKDSKNVEDFKSFTRYYPNSTWVYLANIQIEKLSTPDRQPFEPEMVKVQGGTFQMGQSDPDIGGAGNSKDEQPVHSVTLSSFNLGKYEITVSQFKAFIDDEGYSTDADKAGTSRIYNSTKNQFEDISGVNWKCDAEGKIRPQREYNHPVIHVSWNDATAYCSWLSRKSGKTYRLPTEAEWEYAASNGSKHTKYSWGNGNPSGNNGGNVADETAKKTLTTWTIFDGYNDGYTYTAPVGQYNPNDFGLYDMTGNVWEWCADWYDENYYKNSPSSNPKGASSGSYRVFRGGGWFSFPRDCRAGIRAYSSPTFRNYYVGFRVASALQ